MSEPFEQELQHLLNRTSQENASNTPDFILAQFLGACLAAWNTGVQQRETWYGRNALPGQMSVAAGRSPTVEILETAIRAALNELGVPQPGYPAPVANAVAILRATQFGTLAGAAGGGAPSGQNAAAILERSRTVYWDAPKGPVREIIRLLGDELERRLWASRSTGSEEPARESV